MPAYKKKITTPLSYSDFRDTVEGHLSPHGKAITDQEKAFLNVLFFAGCRISEALALSANDITCTSELVYISFFRLKGSTQTDPIPIPKVDAIRWICSQSGELFSFSRTTGYRIVKRVFPILYPHFFRANSITKDGEKFGLATIKSKYGICARSVDHYMQKVNIKKTAEALLEEVRES